jgi:cobalt-zinc-cadmium resistance protein CzcA
MEKLTEFILHNKLLMGVLMAIVVAAGVFSYNKLPIDAFPDVSPNLVQVFTTTDGLAPEEIEKFITFPVEASMNGLPGVSKIRSVSNFGLSVVNIYFKDEVDLYFARQLVGERLTEAREQIPEGFGEPEMGPISTGMGLVLFYYLEDETGNYSLAELREIQDWIIKLQLQTVPGVTEVLGIGGWEKQFQVEVIPEALSKYSLSISDVIETIESNNLNVGAQFIEKNSEEYVVRSVGLATNIEDLNKIVVKTTDGLPVYLNEVANVIEGGAVRRGLQTKNGTTEVIAGMVVKLFGTNSSTVITEVDKKLEQINNSLPEGIKIVPYYEQKSLVEASIKTVTNALVQGIILVVLVLFIFMGGIRPSIVVGLSIPFSVLFTIIGMNYFGMSANLMSMGGIAIAIGMMVDGTIVIVENVDRLLKERGANHSKAVVLRDAVIEVGKPIIFSVFIIILVFLPLFALQGVEGKTFRPLAYSVALSMFGSLIYAILFAPMISSVLMKQSDKKAKFSVVDVFEKLYSPLLNLFVAKRSLAIGLSVVILAIGAIIFPRLGSEFTPEMQEGTIVVRLSMAPSIALTESKRLTMLVEKRVVAIQEVSAAITRIGRGEVGAHADPVNSAEMYVILEPKEKWRVKSQEEIEDIIRKELGDVPGVLINFTQPVAMTVDELLEGVRAELAIKLYGENLDSLKEVGDKVAAVIAEVSGASDVQADMISGSPQLVINVNRDAIARYGMNVEDVQETIRATVGGAEAGQIFEGVRRYDIVVRYPKDRRDTKTKIENILVSNSEGLKIPLAQLVSVEEVVGYRQITRENSQRFITIQCNVEGRDIGSFVKEGQAELAADLKLPAGYYVTWGGQFRLQQEANKRLSVVIPITLLLVFLVLFASFNSVKNTVLIFLNIPLALVGGVIGLWLTGQNLSVPSSVGFIALFGIALGNGMVMVTFMNSLIQDGVAIDTASVKGALLRLRPVLMTATTTGLGLIPLLISTGTGSEVQRPLATVVIGGIITSTIVTLLVLPAFFSWFSDKPEVAISEIEEL